MAMYKYDPTDPEISAQAGRDPLGALGESAGLYRNPDHSTSIAAGERIRPLAGALRRRVFEILGVEKLTDRELEERPEFERYRYSTVRKRRSELVAHNLVRATGVVRDGLKEWEAVP